MAMWVWRLSNYGDGEWSKPPAQGWDCRRFQINELFQHHELTQGWGIPPLDIRLLRPQWAKTRRDWCLAVDGSMTMKAAEKDYDLLICMLNIAVGDTIFLPKVGANQVSDDHFTVLTVADKYRFKVRGQHPRPLLNQYVWQQDYGHVIPVVGELIRTFPYGANTLERSDFGAPFLKRITLVPDQRFYPFLQQHNYPSVP